MSILMCPADRWPKQNMSQLARLKWDTMFREAAQGRRGSTIWPAMREPRFRGGGRSALAIDREAQKRGDVHDAAGSTSGLTVSPLSSRATARARHRG